MHSSPRGKRRTAYQAFVGRPSQFRYRVVRHIRRDQIEVVWVANCRDYCIEIAARINRSSGACQARIQRWVVRAHGAS